MAITLDTTSKTLEVTTSAAVNTDYVVSYVDMTSSAFTPISAQGTISSAATTTIVSAPAASTQRGIKQISIFNRSTNGAQTVTVKLDVSATEYTLFKATLAAGESLQYSDGSDWKTFDASGKLRVNAPEVMGITGRNIPFYKSGTAADGTAYWYSFSKDSGFPGAWSPGTPGINGRTTDGTTVADAGCIPIWTPTGSLYLTELSLTTTSLSYFQLFDVVWVNTGIVVTTTTAQTMTTPAFPARDLNGNTNGEGYMIGLLTTTANTNTGVITNSTVSYTNSAGTAGRTATLGANTGDGIPATPVIGNMTWFNLAAGDTGVQSIQSITLGTSLGGGAVSLLVARAVSGASPGIVNSASVIDYQAPGIRLWNGSNLLWFHKPTTSTAATINGSVVITER